MEFLSNQCFFRCETFQTQESKRKEKDCPKVFVLIRKHHIDQDTRQEHNDRTRSLTQ